MKNYSDDKFGFVFVYPDNWNCEKEDNVITLYDAENGLGALQLSVYYVGNKNRLDLKSELEDFLQDYESVKVEMKDNLAYSTFNDGDRVWQYWLFQSGNSLIVATYNCATEDKGKENNTINSILCSFVQSSIN